MQTEKGPASDCQGSPWSCGLQGWPTWGPGPSRNKPLTNANIRQQMLLWINEQDSDEWILSRRCTAWSSKLPTASCCLCIGTEGRRMNNTGHKIPVLRSFNEIVSMTIGFILLLSASTHCSAAGSFLEDSVNNGNVPRRKRIGARKPVESLVLCFLALRTSARYSTSWASVLSGAKST